jgi:DNA polymerase (family 10)
VDNREVIRILRDIAVYLDMEGIPFKPRAYEKAAYSLEALTEDLSALYSLGGLRALQQLPGVGAAIAVKIEELLKSGTLAYYEDLKKRIPVDVTALTSIEGLGPKMVKALYESLNIRTIEDLEEAANAGKIRNLPRFGAKSEEKILRGIAFRKSFGGRFSLGTVLALIREVENRLRNLPWVQDVSVAGSIRRRRETVGDADILVVSENAEKVMEFFVSMPEVHHIHGKGHTKTMVKLRNGIHVDLRVVPQESYGAALNYFTGSKDHNVALRKIAQDKGLKLNEYGLFRGSKKIAGQMEEEIYRALDLQYIPPELREDRGEIQAAREGRIPPLIGHRDLKGDLQTQTKWTDGANTIEEMVEEARRIGLTYIAITDHTRSLAMTGGADEEKLLRQMKEIDRINKRLSGFTVLKGAEVNINKDGTLDICDDVLAMLDVVGIAVHSHFNLSRKEMTKRIQRAMENRHADILFHPTGRVINKREPYEVDIDAIIGTAKATGTILEIDALPDRLDLKDDHIQRAVSAGVKLVIDSDAHSAQHFRFLEFGIDQARRGWARTEDVVNTKPIPEFLDCLKK